MVRAGLAADVRCKSERTPPRSRLANTLTNLVMFGPEGCRENGSFDVSLTISRAGQIMISHLNGSFRGDRRAQSRLAHVFTDNKRPDRANVKDTKVRQLLRDQRT